MKSFFKLREEIDACCDECTDDSLYGSVEEDFEPSGNEQYEDWDDKIEEDKGLWANIHAKRQRIKAGSGERMREPGSKGAPTAAALKSAAESIQESTYQYIAHKTKFPERTSKGHYYVGITNDEKGRKGANILKHKDGGYFAASGSTSKQEGEIHSTPEAAAKAYHVKRKEKLVEADTALSFMLKNPGKKLPMHLDPNRPFDPDPPKKNPSALAGKHGQGFSTAKHLAKQGMASIKKEEASPMIKPPTKEFAKKEDAFAHAKKHGGKVMKKTFTHPTSGIKNVSYVVKEDFELDEAKYQKLSPHEKFKNSMKRAGYDMDAGAKRLQDLLNKQKKEREEREKKDVAEGIELQEAEKNGKKVQLNKPFRTSDGKGKFAVYTKNDKGNVVKVNFGDTTGLTIKTSNPDRRRNFRARHNCDTPGPKHKARYWSCRAWSRGTVSAGLGT